jgi:hypothetical protein
MILNTKKSFTLLLFLLAASVQAQAVKEADLPANEKAQLTAARAGAYKADPMLKQLNIDSRIAYRDAMIKVDSSVAPILDKVMPVSGPAMKSSELPAEDQAKYKAAYKAADAADPSLKQKSKAAKQAVFEAAIKADPSVKPIVDKVNPSGASDSKD